MLYLLGADEIDMSKIGADCLVVYQGHHGDAGAHRADIILPSAAYTEQDGLYVNMEGRVQKAIRAAYPPGEAREDWKIIRAISEKAGATLPYNTLSELRAALVKRHPHFAQIDTINPADWSYAGRKKKFSIASEPVHYAIQNYYMTDVISRHSQTMAECMAARPADSTKHKEAA
jgi:NADH-quinone oxidoreductase subunit G